PLPPPFSLHDALPIFRLEPLGDPRVEHAFVLHETPSGSKRPSRHDDNVILSEACTLWASVADDQVVIAMKLSPGSRLRSPVCDRSEEHTSELQSLAYL